MALINCPVCGKSISEFAEKCPNCGSDLRQSSVPQPPQKSRKGLIIGLIVGIVVLVAVVVALSISLFSSKAPAETPVEDTAVVAAEMEPEPEPDPAVQYENTTIKKKFYYKANCDRNLYAEATYAIQWPVSAGTYNIEPLQNELAKICFNKKYTEINSMLMTAGKKFPMQDVGSWTCVKSKGESEYADGGEIEDDYPMFPPSYGVEIKFVSCNEESGLVRYDVIENFDAGTGVGAGFSEVENFVYYDTKHEKVIHFNDVFVSGAKPKLKQMLKTKPILTDVNKSDLWLNELSDVPTNFYFKGDKLYFVFSKYEIAPGCCGNVRLGLKISDIRNLITPEACELFGISE